MKFNIFSPTTDTIIAVVMAPNFRVAEQEVIWYMIKTNKDQAENYNGFYIEHVKNVYEV